MIEAAEAGRALDVIATKLLEHEILQDDGYAVMQRVATEIKSRKKAVDWQFEVDRGTPINFQKTLDKNGRPVRMRIVSGLVHIEQSELAKPPFRALDFAIEFEDDRKAPVARWHIDLANETDGVWQTGPLTHLQYGGHHHDAREFDHPLKAPRWCHPPMEIGLLSEIIAANFFEKSWETLKLDVSWCRSIQLYQKLCYQHYLERMLDSLGKSHSTLLNLMWAQEWMKTKP